MCDRIAIGSLQRQTSIVGSGRMKVNEECVRGPASQPFKVKFETKYPQKGAGSAELFDRAGQGVLDCVASN
jgi:hypothetical protein